VIVHIYLIAAASLLPLVLQGRGND